MIRVKICGNTSLEDALKAVESGADALGFIFSKSPRQVNVSKASNIISKIPPFVNIVGVFVNENEQRIMEIAKRCRLDTFQLHGEESPELCSKFIHNYKVIKVIKAKDEDCLKEIENYKHVDAILLDTFVENVAGGTGKKFNWSLVSETKKFNKPIILAGGLNPYNISEAIEKVNPFGVDVCSGVEKSPGIKDYRLMKEFIRRVKKYI